MPENNIKIDARLSGLQGVIWDLDNTLYRFDGDFEALCHVAAAKAAAKGGMSMAHEEILAVCLQSYDRYGHSYRLLLEEHKLDHLQMHYDFHEFIDEKLISKSVELIELFTRSDLQHVIVTHASGEWAQRALAHIGLKDFFPDNMIIPAEDVDFHRKSESEKPFIQAQEKLGLSKENLVVVEDIAANLSIPYSMGLGTVLVHYGRAPDPMPDYVEQDYNNAIEFFEDVLAKKAAA